MSFRFVMVFYVTELAQSPSKMQQGKCLKSQTKIESDGRNANRVTAKVVDISLLRVHLILKRVLKYFCQIDTACIDR